MLIRAYLKAYGLLLIVFVVIGFWAVQDRLRQRDLVLADTAIIATQQSQLIAKGVTVFHVAARYLVNDVLSRIEQGDLSAIERDQALGRFYDSLLKDKLAGTPFLHGLSVFNANCQTVAASDVLHREFVHGARRCDELRSLGQSKSLHVQLLDADQTTHGGRVIAFTRTFVSPSGEFLGAVSTALDLGFVRDWFGQYSSRHNESITLMGEQGQVLVHISYGQSTQDVSAAFDEMMLREPKGSAGLPFSGSRSYISRDAVYAMSRIEALPMYVLVSYEQDSQLANWREHSVQTGIFVFFLFVLSMASVNSYLRVLQQREALAQLATTDALTGAYNRRYLMEVGNYEVRRASRYGRPLSMLLIDADHFKDINDRWGHGAGDLVLKALSRTIEQNLRQTDVSARIGGEEFVVLLPETPLESAQTLADRLRVAIEMISVQVAANATAGLTVSVGVAMLRHDETLDQLMSRADRCLYDAKGMGRNQVVTADA